MSEGKSPWKPRHGLKPLRRVTENFEKHGVQMPRIPRQLQWSVQRGAGGWMMFTTDSRLSPWLPYSLGGLFGVDSLQQDFHGMKEDFMLCGVNGYGVNSYGLGLIARIGRVMVAQQTGFGGAYNDSAQDRIDANKQMSAWNKLLWNLESMPHGDGPDYFVEFSDFRRIAKVWRSRETPDSSESTDSVRDPWQRNWEVVIDLLPSGTSDDIFFGDLDGEDICENFAVEHLLELANTCPSMVSQAHQLEYEIQEFLLSLGESYDPEIHGEI